MARFVHEIVNPELFSLSPEDSVGDALLGILALGIEAAPVLGGRREPIGMVSLRDLIGEKGAATVGERMRAPAVTISEDATIEETARQLSERALHRMVVVDGEGRAAGIVSAVDLLRALSGLPPRFPQAFPHTDPTGLSWSDPAVLDLEHLQDAPDGPGLFVLIHGGVSRPEVPVWAEATPNVRTRLSELLAIPQDDTPQLHHLLEHEHAHLRYQAASVRDPGTRARALDQVRERVASASGPPAPRE